MDNTQTKRLKVFYSDMLIISPRMFKEGWGGGVDGVDAIQILAWSVFLGNCVIFPGHLGHISMWSSASSQSLLFSRQLRQYQ